MKFRVEYEVEVHIADWCVEYGVDRAEAIDQITYDLKQWARSHFESAPKWSHLVETAEFDDVQVHNLGGGWSSQPWIP